MAEFVHLTVNEGLVGEDPADGIGVMFELEIEFVVGGGTVDADVSGVTGVPDSYGECSRAGDGEGLVRSVDFFEEFGDNRTFVGEECPCEGEYPGVLSVESGLVYGDFGCFFVEVVGGGCGDGGIAGLGEPVACHGGEVDSANVTHGFEPVTGGGVAVGEPAVVEIQSQAKARLPRMVWIMRVNSGALT